MIQQFFNYSWLDITTIQLQELHNQLTNHPCLSPNNLIRNHTNIYTTIQGFVPFSLINTIREYTTSNQLATDITIKFLIKLSQNIYNQIWKPYCIKLSEWKQQNNIPNQLLCNQQTNYTNTFRSSTQARTVYTYSCTCGLPDQQHTGDFYNSYTCPPQGKANKKLTKWISEWINYSTPTNHILHYQI